MKEGKKGIKSIFFDIGGILYDEDKSKVYSGNLAKKFNLDRDILRRTIRKFVSKAQIGELSKKQFSGIVAEELNVKNKEEFLKSWIFFREKTLKLKRPVQRLIHSLKKNYTLGTLTNITPINDIPRIKKKVYSEFDINLVSYREKLKKPDTAFYRLMIKRTKLFPEEIVFIDDDKKNLIPAKKLGINVILFKNSNQLKKDLKKLGVKIT